MEYKIPRGTYDILPAQSYKWQKVIAVFREIASAYGYEEISTPVFEQANLFERSAGESSDVIQKEMYRFEDRKGRCFALRPEGTAPVVRSYVENRMDVLTSRVKLYYIGPMFRYDRPQAGRFRQFYQYGIEFIGSNNAYYDAEVIAILWSYLTKLGLTNIRLELNSVGCPSCSSTYEDALRDHFKPHLSELCSDCQKRFDAKPKRLLECKVPSCKALGVGAPTQNDFLDEECQTHFAEVQSYLKGMSIPFTINPRIVRGLDYYSNTAFEIVYEGIGAQNSLAGGGRYNGLIEQIGGKSIPAIGFAGGFERLLLTLEDQGIDLGKPPAPDVYIITIGETAKAAAIPLLNDLRYAGVYAEYDPDKTSFKAQLKAADNLNARFALIIGEEEIARGVGQLKDFFSGEQKELFLNDLPALVEAMRIDFR
ncbi:MAG: histidine--tRNA ligase [Candidatus Cloacimonadaceae bacterium]|nr:histidine--tRNA ligase [Candidatus Cloacimonadaceae bacterium]